MSVSPFQHIIDEARSWVGPSWKFVDIERVAWVRENGAGGLWYPPWLPKRKHAVIHLGWDQTIDGLWHEVFHSVAHNAPLIAAEPAWCEGWCCAFSENMRQEFATAPVFARDPVTDFERRYSFAATHLLCRAGRRVSGLRQLWLDWNAQPAELLRGERFSTFIGYNPGLVPHVPQFEI